MSDIYTEQLVKQNPTWKTYAFKALLIGLTVISFLMMGLIQGVGTMLLVVMVLVDIYFFGRMDLEYEYLYMNGDLDVDKIMGKQKRKRVFSTNVQEVELIAPQGHEQLRYFQPTKTYDYSSMSPDNKKYEMIVSNNNQLVKVIFEPNAKILDGMRSLAPRKVII